MKKRILLVEQDIQLRTSVQGNLEIADYQIYATSDFQTAQNFVHSIFPDTVVLCFSKHYDCISFITHCQTLYPILYIYKPEEYRDFRAIARLDENLSDSFLEEPFSILDVLAKLKHLSERKFEPKVPLHVSIDS